ncbi:MAG: insulinase family protein [Calditrichaeota bacterium]|nr:insulinase family protein [Calditrichota bacterium]
MFSRIGLVITICLLLVVPSSWAKKGSDWDVEIPFKKYVLKNGLTLIVHEDHKAPIVAVNVWYHVGSKNEKPGRTGFAHLFEHLMFNGSENFDDDYFQALDRIGATDRNGTTNQDRTNYFQNVPVSALDVILWLESDRMGHLLGAITQEKLDEQRGVVQNEKRQGENRPYGKVFATILENTFPKGHPYSWSVIGSMEDLNAATLEDVHEWFKTYYGAANAVLVIAGDVNAEEVKEKVEQYFGDIPSGPPVTAHKVWIPKMKGSHRMVMEDRVPQARIYKVWNVPQWGSLEGVYLDLVSDILSSGKTSRLYKRLVYDDQIATDVAAYAYLREIAGQFIIQATAKPGVDLAEVERAIDEELEKFLREGPTEKELERVKIRYISNFIKGIERIGGFGGKSDILAQNEVYAGDPAFYKVTLQRVKSATPRDLHQTARKWLSDGVFILEVHPFPEYTTVETSIDRSRMPEPGTPPPPKFPEFKRATLSNGLKVIVVHRPTVPVVQFNLIVDAGYAADQFALPGTAKLAMNMLDEGTKKRTALEISEELALLGASLYTSSSLDVSSVYLSALKDKLDPSLEIYADVILNPAFPEADFQRLKKQQLASIQREKMYPIQMAMRVFPKLLYGEGHAYGNPLTGSGTKASVEQIQREDLIRFHQTWFKPNNATLVIVGATTLEEIRPRLEKLFRNWKPGDVPRKNLATVSMPERSQVYIVDKPGALQSVILAGHIAPPKSNPDELAIEMLTTVLGGEFTSRVNMNLREDKHWSYGAGTAVMDARGQRPFLAYAPVQTDKTSESMLEVLKELKDIVGERPVTPEELEKVRKNKVLKLPGIWETNGSVLRSLANMVIFNLPDDYYSTYPEKVKSITLEEVRAVAPRLIHPDKLVWVIVGDREKILPKIEALNLGEIRFIDADGNPVEI